MFFDIYSVRYRRYVYDEEAELYYLKRRYYNPVLCRFISSDFILVSGLITSNQFNYCSDSPIIKTDSNGASWLSDVIHSVNNFFSRIFDTASVGAKLLQMEKEKQNDKDVYHASFDCWQQYFGYTDFYDWAFDMGTSMETRHAPFSYKGKECAIKVWKGDYLNLGAGAEIGIYSKGGLQWKVEKSLAMQMSMTLRLDGNIIADYSAKHWWLTSFVPDYKNVDASSLSVSYVVFFDDTAMYNDFKDKNPAWVCDDMNQSASFSF